MLHHSLGHGPGFPFLEQIFAAHQALKFRELAHHLRHEIVLAEMGCPQRCILDLLRQQQDIRHGCGQRLNALASIQEAAESGSERDALQGVTSIAAGLLPVHCEKEFRVGQPGAEHPFIASANPPISGSQTIAHEQEFGPQHLPGLEAEGIIHHLRPTQWHVALMRLHHRDDDFRGKIQIAISDPPLQHTRILNKIDQFLKQVRRAVQSGIQRISLLIKG